MVNCYNPPITISNLIGSYGNCLRKNKDQLIVTGTHLLSSCQKLTAGAKVTVSPQTCLSFHTREATTHSVYEGQVIIEENFSLAFLNNVPEPLGCLP